MLVKAIQCGLTIEQFWGMTWRDFSIYVIANDRNELQEWAKVRRLSYMIYCSIPTDKTKKSEQSFWSLPIDETEEKKPLSKDQVKNILDFYSR